MTGEFTDKEKLLICGLEAIGLFCGSQELLGAGHRNNTVYTVEDLIKLYDTAGKKRVFKSSGELADWAWKILNGGYLLICMQYKQKYRVDSCSRLIGLSLE